MSYSYPENQECIIAYAPQGLTENRELQVDAKWNTLWFNEESKSDRISPQEDYFLQAHLLKLDSILTNHIR
jgi:hypothetical protein